MAIPKGYRLLEGSERHPVPGARKIGPAESAEVMSVTVAVRRRPDGRPIPDQEHWASRPPAERDYITAEAYAAEYGASADDLAAVAAFAGRHGLEVIEANATQRIAIVSGRAGDVAKAFGVTLGRYEVSRHDQDRPTGRRRGPSDREERRGPETYRGYEGQVALPEELVPIVEGVFGLDNRRMARPAITPLPTITPLTPPQVAELYDFPTTPADIHRETIGLFEFSDPVAGTCGYQSTDIDAYFTTALGIGPGYKTPQLTNIGVNGAANSYSGGTGEDAEVALDISVSGSVAQGAHIAVYFTTWDENGWVLAAKRAVHPHPGERRPSVISISWGWTEFDSFGNLAWTPAVMKTVSDTFAEAAMFGTTVLVASGDDGSNCQVYDGKAHVYFPQSSPWVTTCGGTTIGNVSGSSFTEVTWSDNGITGGGISDVFDLPHWQRHANIPPSVNPGGRIGRGLPDIAGYANGYEIVLGGVSSPGWWGTSETAPLYAGLIAIVNARLRARVGYLNPFLYEHRNLGIFRDIADGRTNATGGAPGYVAGPGWDGCTGLGSIKGVTLLRHLRHEELVVEDHDGVTGKVAALLFDRFGDFEGFVFTDLAGAEHRFNSHEPAIHRLADRAWADRIVTTIVPEDHHEHHAAAIILRDMPT
jgi:kumamolisin